MKKTFLVSALLLLAIFFIACKNSSSQQTEEQVVVDTIENNNVSNIGANIFEVDTATAYLNWKGGKLTEYHNGTLKLDSGNFETNEKGLIIKGDFQVNMNSIVVLDIEDAKNNAKLKEHLEGEDFFETQKFSFATFKITNVTQKEDGKQNIEGDLTIKGITKKISFDATLTYGENKQATLTSDIFIIDRTDWGVQYKSKKFFDNLKDKFIKDELEISIVLLAKVK